LSLCRHLASPGGRPRGDHRHAFPCAPPAGSRWRHSGDGWLAALRGPASDSEALAALATAGRQDRATGASAHPQAEAVHLVPAAVVRLVRTLAHELISTQLLGSVPRTGSHDAGRRQSVSTGTACPRCKAVAPVRTLIAGHVVDMRHRSNRFRPANGTRQPSTGSIRPRTCPESPEPAILARRWRQVSATRRRNRGTCGEPVARALRGC